MRGKLIILFGIDGSGKSTILKMLEKSGLDNIVYTSCLKNAVFEEELYCAEKKLNFSRRDVFSYEFKYVLHTGSVIYNAFEHVVPILDNGKNVILDRYVICVRLFANLFLNPSYNCLSKALDCLPTPDLGIYLDVNVDTAVQRIQERSNQTGVPPHYSESRESLLMKKAGYESMILHKPYPIAKIDANKTIGEVCDFILELLNEVCTSHDGTC